MKFFFKTKMSQAKPKTKFQFLFPEKEEEIRIHKLFYKPSPPENLNIGFLYPLLLDEKSLKFIQYVNARDFCMLKIISEKIPGNNVEDRIDRLKKKIKNFITIGLKEDSFKNQSWFDYVFPIYNGSTKRNSTKLFFKSEVLKKNEEDRIRDTMIIPVFMIPIIMLSLGFHYDTINIYLKYDNINHENHNYVMYNKNLNLAQLYNNCDKIDTEKEELFLENLILSEKLKLFQKENEKLRAKNSGLQRCIKSLVNNSSGVVKRVKIEHE